MSSANLQLTDQTENQAPIGINEKTLISNLNYQYGYGEAWKRYLSNITHLLNEGKSVQTKTLAESIGVNRRNTRKNIQKLIAKGLISITGEHNNRTISLTEKGRRESKKLWKNKSAPSFSKPWNSRVLWIEHATARLTSGFVVSPAIKWPHTG